jgi:hypothetical protein
MITGALIMESLRADARLDDLKLVVREIHRFRPQVTAPEHPDTWSVLEFEADEADAGKLAQALADVLTQPGWYVEFAGPTGTFIVFPGRVIRYPRGNAT